MKQVKGVSWNHPSYSFYNRLKITFPTLYYFFDIRYKMLTN